MMLCESSSPSKSSRGNTRLNSSGSSTDGTYNPRPLRRTWAEEVMRDECGSHSSLLNSSVDSLASDKQRKSFIASECEDIEEEVKVGAQIYNEASLSEHEKSSSTREISLEFLDGANEEKFERLMREDKIKTPFKRRYSLTNKSRSSSPGSGSSGSENNESSRLNYNVEKRARRNSNSSYASTSCSRGVETDQATLARRQKQIDYGKNTLAYERYLEMVPKSERTKFHPSTPDKYGKYSRRGFDGLVKIWRKQLHYYDPPQDDDDEEDGEVSREGPSGSA